MLIPGKDVPLILKEGHEKTLVATLAIGNDQIEQSEKEKQVNVMFQSIYSYISPSWYRNKTKIHKFVLERRFSTVHVCDPLGSIETRNGRRLTDQEEEKRPEGEEFEDKSNVSDAREPYVDIMLNSIAWLEIEINQIQSMWKLD